MRYNLEEPNSYANGPLPARISRFNLLQSKVCSAVKGLTVGKKDWITDSKNGMHRCPSLGCVLKDSTSTSVAPTDRPNDAFHYCYTLR